MEGFAVVGIVVVALILLACLLQALGIVHFEIDIRGDDDEL